MSCTCSLSLRSDRRETTSLNKASLSDPGNEKTLRDVINFRKWVCKWCLLKFGIASQKQPQAKEMKRKQRCIRLYVI